MFRYDLNDQVNGVWLNVINPTATPLPRPNITYDANGNRSTFVGDSYATNNLNQYTTRNNVSAAYDADGNMTASPDSGATQLICTYDAQNRLLTASKGQTTMSFAYDGLNRQVKRSVTGQPDTFSVWDGWDLIEEYQPGSANATAAYVYGGSDLIAGTYNGQVYYYYHDASGSTSHLADSTGHLVEWYRYDLQGTPSFYDQDNNQRNPNQTAYGVRHLFTGQQWYQELGLYDLRNRFYSPDLGRFLQPDPIDFDGDPTNLYRYCGNNPVTRSDTEGLDTYLGTRWLAIFGAGVTEWNNLASHQFVFTTNPDGSVANTYGWGENSWGAFWGTWEGGHNTAYDVRAAQALLSNGNAVFVAGSWFDPYIQQAYDVLTERSGHVNGWAGCNWTSEAERLVNLAYSLYALELSAPPYLDFSGGINTYDADHGVIWVYDSNWNWVGEVHPSGAGRPSGVPSALGFKR